MNGIHHRMMAEAIALARSMQGKVWPNPAVGCVIAHGNEIVGCGHTQFGGRPHAERVALDDAGDLALGATLYVTLEPCCHWGKTPPCADAIIEAGVKAVFASIQDPDPRVNGGGFQKLRDAGVDVHVGLGAAEAQEIMAGFFHRVRSGYPLVTVGSHEKIPAAIPDGFDARIVSGPDRAWLLSRGEGSDVLAEALHSVEEPGVLLQALGQKGLTSVYVASGDQLARAILPYTSIQPRKYAG
ncbi:bifunctional diaminohydroxyphosphoribosylaminopyrimidine deaminase/5-amino-6-(5-phosphoribosylamino)uracil reductase RibD [Rhizobium wenxiniae]|uniref:bifunctional diaminohydroxyphosphoribosylaminopyrimidine deaminase/5-amino-6-(5-phosphoribosylamino)uracil reductase RibD n=1 Tax=Rhizobium wenxiniae TaxID=1737357 RepID=UPI003C21C1EA